MSSRERILNRLRSTFGDAAPAPAGADATWFRDSPAMSAARRRACFAERLAELRAELQWVDSVTAGAAAIEALLAGTAGTCVAHRGPLLDAMKESAPGFADRIDWEARDMAAATVGLTEAAAVVARTGSILLHCLGSGGRRLSVLPPIHVVVAREGQLVASLDEAFCRLSPDAGWSQAMVISGPSRTADIEKVLVLGAHGPGRLVVVVIEAGATQ